MPALREVNLEIYRGEYVALMGTSGSGKTTLLNILGCLDRPSAGTYYLDGEDVSTLSDNQLSEIRSLKVGFIFQSYNLIPQLSVLENIQVPLFYQDRTAVETQEKGLALAEKVGLADRLKHRPFQLSGGQQQRVAIARSLINNPVIILADEPTGNLDSRTGQEILALLAELNRQGKTLVIITHDNEVAAQADHIVRISDGRIT